MKKLLSILGSVGMIGTAGATVVACGNKNVATPPTINKGALKTKITEANGLVENSKKSSEATKALSDAIVIAKVVFDKEDATQEEIGNAITALQTAIDAFNKEADVVNKTALNAKIAEAKEAIATSKKSEEANKSLQTAIDVAQGVANKEDATQAEVDTATNNLNASIAAFKKEADVADKTALNEKIAEAKTLVENSKKSDEVTKALNDAIGVAQAVVENEKATQADVDGAVTTLQAAIETFNSSPEDPAKLDFTKLDEAITSAESALSEGSTKSVSAKKVLELAITLAKSVRESASSQASINSAVDNLNKAIENFKNSINKDALNEKIYEANGLVQNSKKSTEATDKLSAAVNTAQAVVDKEDATQAEVDGAVTQLQDAINAFNEEEDIVDVNKGALNEVIAEANDWLKNVNVRPAQAKTVLKNAVKTAQAVVDKEDATQTIVDKATVVLKKEIQVYNKSLLVETIGKAQRLVKNSKKSEDAVKALSAAIDAAQEVANKEESTKNDVEIATSTLKTEMQIFEESENQK